jgi:pectate lyase
MQAKFANQAVLGILLICQVSVCIGTDTPDANQSSKYLDAVRTFADNVLKYGRDTYGPKHTPLFVDGLNIHTHEPVKWISPKGDYSTATDTEEWILSNFASQQTLMRTLDGLSRITGDPKYREAAMDAIKYAFENLRSPNGLLYWGGHSAYDAAADRPCGRGVHELKGFYPYYELMWEVDPIATKQFIEAFWSAHILDWSNLDMNRHGNMTQRLEEPWKHEYKDGPVFFGGKGFDPIHTGTDLICAAAWLTKLSGEKDPLIWGKRLAYRYIEARNPKTGLSPGVFSMNIKLRPDMRVFPNPIFSNPATWQLAKGYSMPNPGMVLSHITAEWLCECLIGEMLGSDGRQFTQWAREELTAMGTVSYRKQDNVFVPMSGDGTSLEGYVCKEDGPMGLKGTTYEPVSLRPSDFRAYVVVYCTTGDKFMWEMARSIAIGNGYGDIGASPVDKPQLTTGIAISDPYALLGFLELYRKTGKKAFLEMAQRIGNSVLENRLHKGFFVGSKKHIYTKFDTADPLVLLHLHSASMGVSAHMPQVWPGRPFFDEPYRWKEEGIDNTTIYTLTESPEPPMSLQEAAAVGDIDLIRSIIKKGTEVDAREDTFYKTALHRAAISGHKDVVELLLAKGADIEAGKFHIGTALHYAAEKGHKEIAELLIAKGADVNAKRRGHPAGDTPLHSAVRAGYKDIVELLLSKGAEVSSIHIAALLGDLARVKAFLERGTNVNAEDKRSFTPLHWAARTGHTNVAEYLIANGADVNAGEWTPLQEAAYYSKEMVELLLAKGANINTGKWTALHSALDAERFDIVELLLAKGADANIRDDEGRTPLHIAAWYAAGKNTKIVELLLSKGADINAKDNNDKTALLYAIENGHTEIVELLRKPR